MAAVVIMDEAMDEAGAAVAAMATMADPWLLVRAAGGTFTASASAGGDIGSIAVA
jgi:hypothetical protein